MKNFSKKTGQSLYLEGKKLSDNITESDSLNKSKDKLLQAIKLDNNFSEAHAVLGMTLSLLGDNENAEEYLELGIELAEEHDDIESLSLLYNYMGIYYRKILNIRKSIKFHSSQKLRQTISGYSILS